MGRVTRLIFSLLLLPLMFLSFSVHDAAAAGKTQGKIVLDNKELALPKGIVIENVNGSVMIPIRIVVENLGFEVLWEQTSRKVTIKQDFKSVELIVGSKSANADGIRLDLNAAPKQTGGTVLVPIRFVSEQFGLKVGWDNRDKIVYLTGGAPAPQVAAPTPIPSPVPSPTAQVPSVTPGNLGGSIPGIVVSTPSPAASIPGNDGTLAGVSQVKGAVFSENKLVVAVDGSVKPSITVMNNPARIIVDLPGTAFAPEFAGSLQQGLAGNGSPQGKLDVTGYPLVSEIRYALFSVNPSIVRFVIQTAVSQPYQLSTDESKGLVTIDLNTQGVPWNGGGTAGNTGKPVVVLDAGHGGSKPGAVSITGRLEKDFNLAVVRKAGALLEQDGRMTVVYTRTEDTHLELQDRVVIAEAAGATLFLSVHANSLETSFPNWNKINGSETYYSRSESLPFAQIMHKHLLAGTGFKDNGVRYKSLHVTRETRMPAVLLEAGYLTNVDNETALYTDYLQNNLAGEIAAGIKEYLGL
ncbi:N-acetylmuramoyl-L-alanine amidase [Paenibacillus sp. NPDC056722]|uniref:N-acetylmuramoyl-L-alanine amidase n=1 Tax=Paenibacillus sp. NPDC056722 TaxID=3345924 RepID=UPI0036B0B1D6